MRSFTPAADTRFYAGVDLHARNLFLVVLDRAGQAVCARNLPVTTRPDREPGLTGRLQPLSSPFGRGGGGEGRARRTSNGHGSGNG
jgi:hypothetical protein